MPCLVGKFFHSRLSQQRVPSGRGSPPMVEICDRPFAAGWSRKRMLVPSWFSSGLILSSNEAESSSSRYATRSAGMQNPIAAAAAARTLCYSGRLRWGSSSDQRWKNHRSDNMDLKFFSKHPARAGHHRQLSRPRGPERTTQRRAFRAAPGVQRLSHGDPETMGPSPPAPRPGDQACCAGTT